MWADNKVFCDCLFCRYILRVFYEEKRNKIEMKNYWLLLISAIWLIISACNAGSLETPVAQPPAPTATVVATQAITPAAVVPAEGVDWLTVQGKTADNLFYLGNPDAPVTLIDYSDFL